MIPDTLRDPRIRWTNIVPLDIEIVAAKPILASPMVTIGWNKRSLAEVDASTSPVRRRIHQYHKRVIDLFDAGRTVGQISVLTYYSKDRIRQILRDNGRSVSGGDD